MTVEEYEKAEDWGKFFVIRPRDSAQMSKTGGIDLNPIDRQLHTASSGEFSFNSLAMSHIRIESLDPVIAGIEELKSLPEFLGIN